MGKLRDAIRAGLAIVTGGASETIWQPVQTTVNAAQAIANDDAGQFLLAPVSGALGGEKLVDNVAPVINTALGHDEPPPAEATGTFSTGLETGETFTDGMDAATAEAEAQDATMGADGLNDQSTFTPPTVTPDPVYRTGFGQTVPNTAPLIPTFAPPEVPPEEDPGPSDLRVQSGDVASDMMSGDWTQGLATTQNEATARFIANQRAGVANQVAGAGLTQQGRGNQVMQSVEQAGLEATSKNLLANEVAKQSARLQGAKLATEIGYLDERSREFDESLAFNREKYGDSQDWLEFDRLMVIDPEAAAVKYNEITGNTIDVSTLVAMNDRTAMIAGRSEARNIIGELSSDPNNADLAFEQVKNQMIAEVAYNTGVPIDQVSEEDARAYFDGLWNEQTKTGSERFLSELRNDPALAQYFDTPAEAEIMATAIADIWWNGGIDPETGDIREGYIMPWNDPKYSHYFTN